MPQSACHKWLAYPLPLYQMWASGTSGFIAHYITSHERQETMRCCCCCCLACLAACLACLLLLASALDVHLDVFRLPPSPDKWHGRWRRPQEKWFRFAHVASDFLGRISGMFSLHFISDFLKSLGCVYVSLCVCVCVRRVT